LHQHEFDGRVISHTRGKFSSLETAMTHHQQPTINHVPPGVLCASAGRERLQLVFHGHANVRHADYIVYGHDARLDSWLQAQTDGGER